MTKMKLVFVAVLVFVCGALVFGRAALIPVKAVVAQYLLDAAWQHSRDSNSPRRPWPWADTWPVARLQVERLGVSQIVLAGTNGAALAFGPGHLFGSAQPGTDGNVVIAGHRDTHFSYLRDLQVGDRIDVDLAAAEQAIYIVRSTRIVHETDTDIVIGEGRARLTLITCYPFNSLRGGGPLRYVVQADQVTPVRTSI